ncbi:hypothetical protein TR2A62_2124 [Thalassobium sp. R2A62]|nr:hypothetical protein TR2A62_2124 [Thalassobium sp. R2A62]
MTRLYGGAGAKESGTVWPRWANNKRRSGDFHRSVNEKRRPEDRSGVKI